MQGYGRAIYVSCLAWRKTFVRATLLLQRIFAGRRGAERFIFNTFHVLYEMPGRRKSGPGIWHLVNPANHVFFQASGFGEFGLFVPVSECGHAGHAEIIRT